VDIKSPESKCQIFFDLTAYHFGGAVSHLKFSSVAAASDCAQSEPSASSVAASSSPGNILGQKVSIGPQGLSLSCRRLPTETVAINANTEDGSPVIHYDADVVPPPPVLTGARVFFHVT
jgi:hypothetical protein